ncbi:hypothetical protein [Zavarzinella formosa]|uniref:hypothetical protein n=1 Tax=Zavarzinella formosa TaxID=360055 RepID=UPI0002F9B405|nr:hypothetical protein [Zavarzinella formosa]
MTFDNRWEWGNVGVALYENYLTWYEQLGAVAFASGAASDQEFDDFLKNGPFLVDTPADVVAEVRQAVIAHLAKRNGK